MAKAPTSDSALTDRERWSRLARAGVEASVLGLFGFAAFVLSLHVYDPPAFLKPIEAIGLPLLRIGAEIDLLWTGVAASVLLWSLVLYIAHGKRAARKRVPPPSA